MKNKKRFAHFLKHNERKRSFSDFLFFDTESYLVDNGKTIDMPLRLGVCVYVRREGKKITREKWYTFRTPDEFLNIIFKCLHGKNTLHIISMNLHHDIGVTNIINLLCEKGFTVTSMYLNGLTVIIRMRKNAVNICFEDGSNRLRGSIKRWGEILGIPKLQINDYNIVSDEELEIYCKRDVEILYKAHMHFFEFVQENDMGNESYTIAGQSFNAYRHRYMHRPIVIHDNEEALQLERLSYGGGRVSTFKVGTFTDGTFYYLDVNSMYPYVMKNKPYPYKLIAVLTKCSVPHLIRLCKDYAVIADVVISPTKPAIRRHTKDKTLYPCYPCRVVLTTPELNYCIMNDWIVAVNKVTVYEQDFIFTAYVDDLYNMRKRFKEENNDVYAEICKLMLNSLYGRFGIRSRSIVPLDTEIELLDGIDFVCGYKDKKIKGVYHIGDKFYTEIDAGEGDNSFPAIASTVTGYARMYLWSLIEIAGLENVYYTDTDSLITNEEGYKRLLPFVNPTELGYLKLEGIANYLQIRSRKDYTFGEITKLKGIPKDSQQLDDNTYIRIIWPKLRSTLSEPVFQYSLIRQKVHLYRQCYDGTVMPDGTVHPFTTPPPHLDKDPLTLYP